MTTDPDALSRLAKLAGCPHGATPTDGIALITYYDPDGEPRMVMTTYGEAIDTSRLGLLAWAQHAIVADLQS